MNLQALGDETYIALETFKKSGEGKITPVWVTKHNGKLLVITDGNSWKVKRIRNNSRVRIAKSDARGTPLSDFVEANASIISDQTTVDAHLAHFRKKYHVMWFMIRVFQRLSRNNDDKVIIEIA